MDTAGLPEQGAQAQTLGQWLVPGGVRPSQRETPSPSSPGQGSSQDVDGFPDGAWVVGTGQPPGHSYLALFLWRRAFGSPRAGEDGAGEARGRPPTPPACPNLVCPGSA